LKNTPTAGIIILFQIDAANTIQIIAATQRTGGGAGQTFAATIVSGE
jgi:hypothetical protein